MTTDFSARAVHDALTDAIAEAMLHQVTDRSDPRFGGIVDFQSNLATARRDAHFLAGVLWLEAADGSSLDAAAHERSEWAALHLARVQRETGRFDEPDCNIDSGPATGFILQVLLPAMRASSEGNPGMTSRPEVLSEIVSRAYDGLLDGGFHTPNHRWVWASALAQGADSIGTAPPAVLEDILAEGVDIDADGAYIERSIESYDAVTNLSLLLLDEHLGWPAALPAIERNLEFDTHLLHADGTVDTSLSRRWGGIGKAPLGLAAAALVAADRLNEPRLAAMAKALWTASDRSDLAGLAWMAWAAHKAPQAFGQAGVGDLPERFSRFFPATDLWRHRVGKTSVSVLGESPNILAMRFGRAQLVRTSARFSYFGPAGDFIGQSVQGDPSGVTLHFDGQRLQRRPAYEMPLGEPVDPARWELALARRAQRTVAPQAADLTVRPLDDGVSLELTNTDGLADTPGQIALDFAPGGRWESPADLFTPQPGSSIVLRRGPASMRYGPDAISIETDPDPARSAHTWPAMRDAPAPGDCVRVVIPLVTPVNIRVTLTGRTGL